MLPIEVTHRAGTVRPVRVGSDGPLLFGGGYRSLRKRLGVEDRSLYHIEGLQAPRGGLNQPGGLRDQLDPAGIVPVDDRGATGQGFDNRVAEAFPESGGNRDI